MSIDRLRVTVLPARADTTPLTPSEQRVATQQVALDATVPAQAAQAGAMKQRYPRMSATAPKKPGNAASTTTPRAIRLTVITRGLCAMAGASDECLDNRAPRAATSMP